MANRKVTLLRMCKTAAGWRRLPIVMGKNGRIRPGYALLEGEPTAFESGYYVLRTYEGKRTVYVKVGESPSDALASQQRHSQLAALRADSKEAGVSLIEPDPARLQLERKRVDFRDRHLAKGQKRAAETSDIAIRDFLSATSHTYVDQITEDSILAFYRSLRARGNEDRTIYNKHVSLFGFFKWLKLDTKLLASRPPSYTQKEPVIYSLEDIKVLIESAPKYQQVIYETLLKTGMRMQEAMYLDWTNVDFRDKKIKVRERLDNDEVYDVRIKDRGERSIPLNNDLAVTLKNWRKKNPTTQLVLGTRNDTPNWKWLVMLKRAAKNAGLNCRRCSGCKGKDECERWNIKRFRSTYTTTMLREGFDPKTVMFWTGHKDLATVLLYAAADYSRPTQDRARAVRWL